MKQKREAEQAQQEPKGILSSLRSFISRDRDNTDERFNLLTPEEAQRLNVLENKQETLLSEECFLCGSAYIETLDMPFDSIDELNWIVSMDN